MSDIMNIYTYGNPANKKVWKTRNEIIQKKD